ncbi:hypothetical protein N7507_001029 [Penicillium longicatenatum]|nr:hypothetical protein N7507_001029 [Penicillium longicatenatum]
MYIGKSRWQAPTGTVPNNMANRQFVAVHFSVWEIQARDQRTISMIHGIANTAGHPGLNNPTGIPILLRFGLPLIGIPVEMATTVQLLE